MKFALQEKGQGMVEYKLGLVFGCVTVMGPLVGQLFFIINNSP